MNVVPQIARRSGGWGWFVVWALLGSAAALSTVSLGPLLLFSVALFGVFLWTRPGVRRSAFGLLTGAGALLLYVAWVQRDGPGTTCWHTAAASGCDPASESAAVAYRGRRPGCRWLRRARAPDLSRLDWASVLECPSRTRGLPDRRF